ncbi:long chain fatty acid elongation enzyme, putative [Plasmodium berghei]|uniref:Elongation of fatty acids protein n=2 Tax=Plasmodium berghei TaxID=5821 RepID=A0A509AJI5_PLABA|nr:long chain fatty acid elongation enzyme, putative [Plasmodium berghei ANKA]CXI33508.1 long chain fatty acid elongation enzyme, putative [Plasmodium berghei]SCM21270.1 long chain fatty acid elongation enzyme, putative [Plasmodium berghei]SCN24562.1 long chain fatty acid elongation enzyme, putative [Plasmodium berghei]SCO59733.1 long chain fatty acid elongation enzyme, putative [Plasmodium berghei]SCO60959.1 long chain fatty acid elongation enzyme, putative [Plasmodium berghei]|eukprot:XP_034421181.1 long chain fatty acid elongation enzyme, putative [Plasmodium berghei ANKA]
MKIINEKYWIPGKGRELAIKYEPMILAISFLYIPIILIFQEIMKKRKEIEAKYIKILWNLSLSFFSFLGVLFIILYDKNVLKYLILEEKEYSAITRAVICIFTLTKVIEYGDTLFLILKKKKLTFLHSYHHLTVVIYCLYSQKELVSHAHYFVFLNLIVHSIMYCYFGCIYIIPKIVYRFRKLITCLQIFQMFIGIFISYYAIKNVDNNVYINNAIASFTLYLTYAFLFLNFYFNNYYRNIKGDVATYMITIHVLGFIGFIMLCKSKDILKLFVEVLVGSIFTLSLLKFSFYFNENYYYSFKNKIPETNFNEQMHMFKKYKNMYYSNMALLKKIIINMIKTFLLCFNGFATYAHDNIFIFVNFYSKKIKEIQNEGIILEKQETENYQIIATKNQKEKNYFSDNIQKSNKIKDENIEKKNIKSLKNSLNFQNCYNLIKYIYNASIISYIISKPPIDNISRKEYQKNGDISVQPHVYQNYNLFYIIKKIIKSYLLYLICLIIPIYYGLKVYNDAILGLCVHGAFRWVIEIYSTKIFKKSDKKKFY